MSPPTGPGRTGCWTSSEAPAHGSRSRTRGRMPSRLRAAPRSRGSMRPPGPPAWPSRRSSETDLPFPVSGAIRLGGQAQIHAGEMLRLLAEALRSAGGHLVTKARVIGVSAGSPPVVTVRTGSAGGGGAGTVEVTAEHVVLATGTPILDRALHFARLEPQRSYALALRVPGAPPAGMYLSADQPSRSLRSVTVDDETLLLLGGEGHVVGRGGSARARVDALVQWAHTHFPGAEVTHQWSAQDYRSTRRLPLAGPLPGEQRRRAGRHGIREMGHDERDSGSPGHRRQDRRRSAPVVRRPLRPHRARHRHRRRGQAEHIRRRGARAGLGGSHDPFGAIRRRHHRAQASSPGMACAQSPSAPWMAPPARCRRCAPHLGGVVSWNDAERSWDCPLHGSRFAANGRRLEGPAVHDLPSVDLRLE